MIWGTPFREFRAKPLFLDTRPAFWYDPASGKGDTH